MTDPTRLACVAVACPVGFSASRLACGIKPTGDAELALICCEQVANVAAVFTQNLVRAAPIEISAQHLQRSGGRIRALLINSGIANAATGPEGIRSAQQTVDALAAALECEDERILINSTGVIGEPLPANKIVQAIPSLVDSCTSDGLMDAAKAIMTTDTVPKTIEVPIHHQGRTAQIVGIAKGSGMIHPNMATMIAVLMTDAIVEPNELDSILRFAVERSFQRISVDGDTSTNDSVFAMASGRAGAFPGELIQVGMTEAARELAIMLVRDGEGAQKLIQVRVTGARTNSDALQVARTVAMSSLVRTAVAGGDPNWGRILAAIGRSGVDLDLSRLVVSAGDVPLFRNGSPASVDIDCQQQAFHGPDVKLQIDLGSGDAAEEFFSCDLTEQYVHIDATYTT